MARPKSDPRSARGAGRPPTLFDMAMTAPLSRAEHAAAAAARFPRLRYMGSKHRLVPHLAELFGSSVVPQRSMRSRAVVACLTP